MRLIRILLIWLVVLGAAGGGAYWWLVLRPAADLQTQAAAGRRGPLPIPVVVAAAESRDVPIYLDGLGTALASANVTVRSQIDGKLIEVRFDEGQDVHVGDVLARLDPRPYQAALDQMIAKKAQDEATLANARLDAERYAKLAVSAYTPAQQADTAKSLVAQLTAQVAGDQAQIDNARTQLSYTTITAPIDGRVGIRQVDAGNIVHAADANGLVVLTTLKPISVVFTLPQQALGDVTKAMAEHGGQAGTVPVLALPQSNDDTTARAVLDRGTLTVLDNQVDPTTGTIKLKASFPNAELKLWPGAFVTVRLQAQILRGATVVAPVAIQRGPRGTYVFVIDGDVAKRRDVTVTHEDLRQAVVADGLKPGEQVVVDGAARLSDGSKVTAVNPVADTAPPRPATPPRGAGRRASSP